MLALLLPKLVVFVCIGIFSVEVLGVDPTIDIRGYIYTEMAVIQCRVSDMPSTGYIEFSKVSPGEPFIIENQAGIYQNVTVSKGDSLLLTALTKENEGNYQCTVRDGDNQWTSEQFYLEYKGYQCTLRDGDSQWTSEEIFRKYKVV